MVLLDGKKLADKILVDCQKNARVKKLRLAVILIGENPVSQIFIDRKKMACEKTGIGFKLYQFGEKTNSEKLKKEIAAIANDAKNSGIIIQLPLPKRLILKTQELLNLIPPEKDVDVLSEASLGKFYSGTLPILPPTVSGIAKLLAEYKIKIKGKNVAVVGIGRLVGNPLAVWLLRQKATVSTINEFTKDASSFSKKADILVAGVGQPNLIKGNMVKSGVVAIDAGSTVEKGRVAGDIDFKSVSQKASYITPVPGGVGPMTVACLLENLVKINE